MKVRRWLLTLSAVLAESVDFASLYFDNPPDHHASSSPWTGTASWGGGSLCPLRNPRSEPSKAARPWMETDRSLADHPRCYRAREIDASDLEKASGRCVTGNRGGRETPSRHRRHATGREKPQHAANPTRRRGGAAPAPPKFCALGLPAGALVQTPLCPLPVASCDKLRGLGQSPSAHGLRKLWVMTSACACGYS